MLPAIQHMVKGTTNNSNVILCTWHSMRPLNLVLLAFSPFMHPLAVMAPSSHLLAVNCVGFFAFLMHCQGNHDPSSIARKHAARPGVMAISKGQIAPKVVLAVFWERRHNPLFHEIASQFHLTAISAMNFYAMSFFFLFPFSFGATGLSVLVLALRSAVFRDLPICPFGLCG